MSNSAWQKKVWGVTRPVMVQPGMEVHEMEVVPGGYCSCHRHKVKYNLFVVETGRVFVRAFYEDEASQMVWNGMKGDWQTKILEPGDTLIVGPGRWHQFRSGAGAKMKEVYWGSWNGDDIERYTPGGILPGGGV